MFVENNFLFNHVDSALSHLSFSQIVDLINRYYNGEKNKELLLEYNISLPASKLVGIFPLVKTNIDCDCCKIPMVSKLNSKTSSNKLSSKDLHCNECGHYLNIKCKCHTCLENDILEQAIKEQEEKMLNDEKYKYLEELQSKSMVEEENLDLRSKFYLATVLRECLNEEGDRIENLVKKIKLISPYRDFTDEILQHLIGQSLIIPSLDNDLENIVKRDRIVYYIYHVRYRLNIRPVDGDYKKMIHRLIYPKTELFLNDKNFCYEMWKKIAFYEAMQYLIFKMESVRYDFTPGVKTITVFENLVEKFSVGQIYNIIYNPNRG